jgi:hypothetical protein
MSQTSSEIFNQLAIELKLASTCGLCPMGYRARRFPIQGDHGLATGKVGLHACFIRKNDGAILSLLLMPSMGQDNTWLFYLSRLNREEITRGHFTHPKGADLGWVADQFIQAFQG